MNRLHTTSKEIKVLDQVGIMFSLSVKNIPNVEAKCFGLNIFWGKKVYHIGYIYSLKDK